MCSIEMRDNVVPAQIIESAVCKIDIKNASRHLRGITNDGKGLNHILKLKSIVGAHGRIFEETQL